MNWFNRYCLFSIWLLYGHIEMVQAKPAVEFPGSDRAIIKKFLSLHQEYFRRMCLPVAEKKYSKLIKDYRGGGYFIPIIDDIYLDRKTIRKHLPDLKNKVNWIKNTISQLKSYERYSEIRKDIKELNDLIYKQLDLRKMFIESDFDTVRKRSKEQGQENLQAIKVKWKYFLGKVFFLLGYKFPQDHLKLRKDYDTYKDKKGKAKQRLANDVYFYRKIVEDGAQDPDHSNSDRYTRTALNTIYIELDKVQDFLSEDVRYDLQWILKKLDRLVGWEKERHLQRLEEWHDRTLRTYRFYRRLVASKKAKKGKKSSSDSLLEKKSKAKFRLEKFNANKQADSYLYWAKQKEIYQALYAMTSILFNEVGDFDGPNALERKDIIQVILNRRVRPFYTQLDHDQKLYSVLRRRKFNSIKEHPWLNLMFKEGEFSFTYYFISSSVKVYCPDMSRRGKKIRLQNIKMALKLLKNPNEKFVALRYFSRASMLGKIDMTTLWVDFEVLPERVGVPIRNSSRLKRALREGDYHYLYRFLDETDQAYNVVEIADKTYVYKQNGRRQQFYTYRNPHYFKYFRFRGP